MVIPRIEVVPKGEGQDEGGLLQTWLDAQISEGTLFLSNNYKTLCTIPFNELSEVNDIRDIYRKTELVYFYSTGEGSNFCT